MTGERTFRRSELYALVWSKAVQRVAADIGISGVAVAKACRNHGIPLPGRGSWTRRQFGHRVKQPPRPALLLKLLLCNGYQLNIDREPAFDVALGDKQWDAVGLLLEWGADATRADPDTVLDTYRTDLFERFWQAGNDFTRDDCLARYLAMTSSNRPLYGWVRRHRMTRVSRGRWPWRWCRPSGIDGNEPFT